MVVTNYRYGDGRLEEDGMDRARLARCTPDVPPGDRAACRNKEAIQTLRMRGCSGRCRVKGRDFAAAKPPLL